MTDIGKARSVPRQVTRTFQWGTWLLHRLATFGVIEVVWARTAVVFDGVNCMDPSSDPRITMLCEMRDRPQSPWPPLLALGCALWVSFTLFSVFLARESPKATAQDLFRRWVHYEGMLTMGTVTLSGVAVLGGELWDYNLTFAFVALAALALSRFLFDSYGPQLPQSSLTAPLDEGT